MGYKCTPQLKGLVRGEPKPGKKFRANGRAIAEEAGNERYSKSETLDRSRSTQNVYDGYKSGGACWEAMCEDAGAYRITGKTKNGKPFERSLREDAVIGFALIFNPPDEMTIGWTDADYDKFYADSFDAMREIEPRLFRKDNIRMTAEHHDEGNKRDDGTYGLHKHYLGDCLDEDGHYCGNLIDVKLMNDINAKYPTFMRQRGWDLEDLDITDRSRMGKNPDGTYKDPEYREQRLNRRKSGRSVNEYLSDIAADKKAELDAYSEASYQEKIEAEAEFRIRLKEIAEKAEAEYARREAESNEREAALDEREAALDAKEKRRERDNEERKAALDVREAELNHRSSLITLNEDWINTMTDISIELEGKVKALDDAKLAAQVRDYKRELTKGPAIIEHEKQSIRNSAIMKAKKSPESPIIAKTLRTADDAKNPVSDSYGMSFD